LSVYYLNWREPPLSYDVDISELSGHRTKQTTAAAGETKWWF